MTNVVSAMEIREHLGDTLNKIHYRNEIFFVERQGQPVAVMMSNEYFKAIAPYLEDYEDVRDALRALEEYRAGEGKPFSEFVKELRAEGILQS